MKQENVSRADIQNLLGVSEKTVRNKLSGETDFTWGEVRKIRNNFFPKDDFNKLFEQTESE
jgi:transcriptional antiterminator